MDDEKDLNSPKEFSDKAKKELVLVEKKLQEGHVDRVDPGLDCILVILPSIPPTVVLCKEKIY